MHAQLISTAPEFGSCFVTHALRTGDSAARLPFNDSMSLRFASK
jgi:hypothetical protein